MVLPTCSLAKPRLKSLVPKENPVTMGEGCPNTHEQYNILACKCNEIIGHISYHSTQQTSKYRLATTICKMEDNREVD